MCPKQSFAAPIAASLTFAALAFAALAFAALTFTSAPATAAPAAAPVEPAQPFSIQDMVRMERISEVAVAPDGKRVAYTQRSTDMEANKGRTSIWLLDTAKRRAAPVPLIAGGDNANSAQWSGDGQFIYFLSNHGGSSQVWRVSVPASGARADAPAAAPTQVTHLPLDVGSFRVSRTGGRILVSLEVFLNCADLPCTKQRLDKAAHAAATGALFDQLFIRHWDTWRDGRLSQLFSMPLDGSGVAQGNPVNLTGGIGDVPSKPFGGREDYAFSPDSLRVVFSVRASSGEAWSTNFDIYESPADGGALPRNLTADNKAWDAQPAYSPDGSQLAYLAMDRPGFEADRFHLVLLDVQSGARRPLTQNWDRSIAGFAWSSDGKTLFATTDHLGQRP